MLKSCNFCYCIYGFLWFLVKTLSVGVLGMFCVTHKIRRGPDMGCLCLHIIKGEDHFYTLNAHFIFAKFRTVLHLSKRVVVVSFSKLIQYNAHNGEDSGRSERCLPVLTHKKGEGSFRHVQCPFHSCAKFNNFAPAWVRRADVVQFSKLVHLQCTMSSIFDWEVRRLSMRERVKTRNDNGLRIWIFPQKLPFFVGNKMFQRQI